MIAVAGLFTVQYQYLRIGLNLAKVQFDKKIGDAVKQIRIDLASQNQLTFLLGEGLKGEPDHFNISSDSLREASSFFLDDFISNRLILNGIDADYTYNLYSRDSLYYLRSPKTFSNEDEFDGYPVELTGYLPELLDKQVVLELKFHDRSSYFLKQLNGLTIPGLIFTLIIIGVFILVLKSLFWQRELITTTNEFINNLTHELKTPVFSIGLAVGMLGRQIDTSKKQYIEIIKEQLNRLSQLIDQVLKLSEIEHSKTIFEIENFDFKPTLQDVCHQFEGIASLEGINFTYRIPGDNYFVLGERSHLENSILNILDNARKYRSANAQITLEAMPGDSSLEIEISDNGPGINQDEIKDIFRKYYRASNGGKPKVPGYGLGLSYAYEVIKRHNGQIRINSEPGKGTAVHIKLPLKKNDGN